MTLILDEGELRSRLGRKALLGVQQEGGVDYDIFGRHRLCRKGPRCQLKHGRRLVSIIQHRPTFAVHPVRVVVLVILLGAITALGHPNHACNQIVERKLGV